jgi:GDPmannose 4,6-dehydratase
MKRAIITGVTGQDGSYPAEMLPAKGYEVHGVKRRSSSFYTNRVDGHYRDFYEARTRFLLRVSCDIPGYAAVIAAAGALRLLESIRMAGLRSRFSQASSGGKR